MTKATAANRRLDGGRRVPVDRRRLPAAPLREAIDTYAKRRRRPVEELLGEGLERVLRDAARTGTVTVASGERCCDALGWHPRMVWGDLYDHTIADDTPHTATAPAGTSTGWRQGCRCLDCRDANRAAIGRATTSKPSRGGGHPRDPPSPTAGHATDTTTEGQEDPMASDNFTVQVGNLTDDPELRFTQNGTPVANFRLAVNQRVKQDDGSWRDGEASFFKVNVWRDQAENVAESLGKGHRAVVLGRLRTRSWETPEGDKRSSTEIDADEVAPSLKWATARPERADRGRNGERGTERGQFNDPAPF
jgi:single-strand DNA-binding protein